MRYNWTAIDNCKDSDVQLYIAKRKKKTLYAHGISNLHMRGKCTQFSYCRDSNCVYPYDNTYSMLISANHEHHIRLPDHSGNIEVAYIQATIIISNYISQMRI